MKVENMSQSSTSSPAPETAIDADVVRALEAVLLVATEPVPVRLLGEVLNLAPDVVDGLCRSLAEAYDEAGHGFELVQVAGGYRYQTRAEFAPYVERYILDGQRARLSGAALETLAIVAYKQPISRSQIASIRGVDPDGVLRTLQSRGYIDQVGRDPGPGQAVMWGTTPAFLEKLGINSIGDLPPIVDFVPGADVVEALEVGLRIPRVDEVATVENSPAPSTVDDEATATNPEATVSDVTNPETTSHE